MTTTDLIILGLSGFLIVLGASRGFIKSLLGPFSLIVATVLSIIYFQITKDLIVSLCIGLFGPIVMHFCLKIITNTSTGNHQPSPLSRLAGAILTLAWGSIFIAMTLTLFILLPPWGDALKRIHDDVHRSTAFSFIKPYMPAPEKKTVSKNASPAENKNIESLAQDPRFQKIFDDPSLQKDLSEQNIAKLMSNPKIMSLAQELMSDPEMMKKLMAIYQMQATTDKK